MTSMKAWIWVLGLGLISTTAARAQAPQEAVRAIFGQPISNIPGKMLQVAEVTYPPGGRSPAHRHALSAFIFAYVLSGAVRSQVEAEPARVYQTGETFFEPPGAHHAVSENASATEPARLLAVFVVDAADEPLTKPDTP
jgi:quercetin dioxygenase-like cupin family protein